MRIENINEENVRLLQDIELKNLKEVASQLHRTSVRWGKQLAKRMIGINQPIKRDRLLQAAEAIAAEIKVRGLDTKESDLDAKIARKALRGIDVAELPIILVKSTVVSLSGPFVVNPKKADAIEVRIDADELDDDFTDELEKRMVEGLMDQTGKSVSVHRDAEGLESPVIPVYDLVLVPRGETIDENDIDDLLKRLESRTVDREDEEIEGVNTEDGTPVIEYTDISKPFPNEHAARQASPGKFDRFRRKNNELGSGIHVIYGVKTGDKPKVQSIRFDAKKFTVAQAKAWLKEHKYKSSVEAATGKVKKTDVVSFVKNAEERIVGGIVYAVGEVDSQGDYVAKAEDLFEAMKSWMLKGHPAHFMHNGKLVATPLIECFQATEDMRKDGQPIPAGAWYISNYIPEKLEDLWCAIKDGSITGYSMSGTAKVTEVEAEMDE